MIPSQTPYDNKPYHSIPYHTTPYHVALSLHTWYRKVVVREVFSLTSVVRTDVDVTLDAAYVSQSPHGTYNAGVNACRVLGGNESHSLTPPQQIEIALWVVKWPRSNVGFFRVLNLNLKYQVSNIKISTFYHFVGLPADWPK